MKIQKFATCELVLVNGLPDEVINKVYELKENPVLGRYEFGNGLYMNVETYETSKFEDKDFEAHKEYVDVQIVLRGCENIYVARTNDPSFRVTKEYVPDIMFMDGPVENHPVTLEAGECCVLEPEHAHKPCIRIGRYYPEQVIKAVIKIPLDIYRG